MKKVLALALVMALALFILTACGGNGNDNNMGNGNTTQPTEPPTTITPQQTTPPGGSTPAPSNNATPTPETTPAPTTEPTPEPTPEPVAFTRILEATIFSDGVAWVLPYIEGVNTRSNPNSMHNIGIRANGVWRIGDRPHTPGIWHLVDINGNTLLVSGENESPITPFSNGAGLITRADGTIEMINKAGEILSSPTSGDYEEILFFLQNYGAMVVRRQVNTWELTETQFGIIGSNGEWLLPIQGNFVFPMENRSDIQLTLSGVNAYLGDGIFRISSPPDHNGRVNNHGLFNILTGEAFLDILGLDTMPNFENGYGIYVQWARPGGVHVIDTEFNTNRVFEGTGGAVVLGEYREGLFYMATSPMLTAHTAVSDRQTNGFYDRDGNLIIDLEHLTVLDRSGGTIFTRSGEIFGAPVLPHFSGGYSVLILRNDQRADFYTIIDKNGTFMFEPRPYTITNTFHAARIDSGLLLIHENNSVVAMNMQGETVFVIENFPNFSSAILQEFKFNDGVARIFSGGEVFFIDTTGQRLF